jgi:transposase
MGRRKFSREFKLEAVRLVRERGVSMAQAARDLDLHVNVLRKWVRDRQRPREAFLPQPGLPAPDPHGAAPRHGRQAGGRCAA